MPGRFLYIRLAVAGLISVIHQTIATLSPTNFLSFNKQEACWQKNKKTTAHLKAPLKIEVKREVAATSYACAVGPPKVIGI